MIVSTEDAVLETGNINILDTFATLMARIAYHHNSIS